MSEYNINMEELIELEEISEIHNLQNFHIDEVNNENIEIDSILSKINTYHLNDEENKEIKKLVIQFKDTFLEEETLSFTHNIKHQIITNDEIPTKSKIYRYPYIH